jgi:hypothetical protein
MGVACSTASASVPASDVEALFLKGPLAGFGYSAIVAAAIAAVEQILAGGHMH